MSKANDIQFVRNRFASGMGASVMNLVRFKLNNISIQFLQYAWLGDLVKQGRIRIDVGSGDNYDHNTDIIGIDDPKCWFSNLVHEGTHAIIDGCNPGLTITKGSGEACAYLAETMFSIAWRDEVPDLIIPHLTRPMAALARRALAFNSTRKSSFECDGRCVARRNHGHLEPAHACEPDRQDEWDTRRVNPRSRSTRWCLDNEPVEEICLCDGRDDELKPSGRPRAPRALQALNHPAAIGG